MSVKLMAWLRLQACPPQSPERKLANLLRQVGLSGVAERCGCTQREVLVWVQLREVPPEFAEMLAPEPKSTPAVDSLIPRYRELREQGLTLQAIADECGVTKQAVSKGLKSAEV